MQTEQGQLLHPSMLQYPMMAKNDELMSTLDAIGIEAELTLKSARDSEIGYLQALVQRDELLCSYQQVVVLTEKRLNELKEENTVLREQLIEVDFCSSEIVSSLQKDLNGCQQRVWRLQSELSQLRASAIARAKGDAEALQHSLTLLEEQWQTSLSQGKKDSPVFSHTESVFFATVQQQIKSLCEIVRFLLENVSTDCDMYLEMIDRISDKQCIESESKDSDCEFHYHNESAKTKDDSVGQNLSAIRAQLDCLAEVAGMTRSEQYADIRQQISDKSVVKDSKDILSSADYKGLSNLIADVAQEVKKCREEIDTKVSENEALKRRLIENENYVKQLHRKLFLQETTVTQVCAERDNVNESKGVAVEKQNSRLEVKKGYIQKHANPCVNRRHGQQIGHSTSHTEIQEETRATQQRIDLGKEVSSMGYSAVNDPDAQQELPNLSSWKEKLEDNCHLAQELDVQRVSVTKDGDSSLQQTCTQASCKGRANGLCDGELDTLQNLLQAAQHEVDYLQGRARIISRPSVSDWEISMCDSGIEADLKADLKHPTTQEAKDRREKKVKTGCGEPSATNGCSQAFMENECSDSDSTHTDSSVFTILADLVRDQCENLMAEDNMMEPTSSKVLNDDDMRGEEVKKLEHVVLLRVIDFDSNVTGDADDPQPDIDQTLEDCTKPNLSKAPPTNDTDRLETSTIKDQDPIAAKVKDILSSRTTDRSTKTSDRESDSNSPRFKSTPRASKSRIASSRITSHTSQKKDSTLTPADKCFNSVRDSGLNEWRMGGSESLTITAPYRYKTPTSGGVSPKSARVGIYSLSRNGTSGQKSTVPRPTANVASLNASRRQKPIDTATLLKNVNYECQQQALLNKQVSHLEKSVKHVHKNAVHLQQRYGPSHAYRLGQRQTV